MNRIDQCRSRWSGDLILEAKAEQGAVLGGVLGEVIDDDEGEEGLIIGALAGGALGYIIGNEMDKRDQRKFERTLETNKDGQTCREFIIRMETNGKTERSRGVSCQKENDEWEVMSQKS